LISLLAHSSLFYLFWQEPQPLLGIGTEAITVELEIGDSRPVGATTNQGAEQVDAIRVDEIKGNDNATEVQKATEAPEVKPEERRTDAVKEQAAERPKEQKREERPKIDMVETQQAEVPTVRPRETSPDMQAVIAPPQGRSRPSQSVAAESRNRSGQAASGVGIVISASAWRLLEGVRSSQAPPAVSGRRPQQVDHRKRLGRVLS
jgi:outer membrane biosynthesis protein TonB